MAIQIKATFPKANRERNGLDAVSDALLKSPMEPVHIVGVVEVVRIVEDMRTGEKFPVVNFRALEATNGDDAVTVSEIMRRNFAARTGRDEEQGSLFEERSWMEDQAPQPDDAMPTGQQFDATGNRQPAPVAWRSPVEMADGDPCCREFEATEVSHDADCPVFEAHNAATATATTAS